MKGGWFLLLGGLIVWAGHFVLLYIIAEAVGGTTGARLAIGALTLIALAADIAILRSASLVPSETEFDRWRRSLMAVQAGLSAIAIIWQSLPALM